MVWKKEKTGVVDYLWKKDSKSNNYGNFEVWVYKTRDKNKKIIWVTTIRDVGGATNNKPFTTKSKALAYAKSYMRKH